MTEPEYEYQVLAKVRCYYGAEHFSVRNGHIQEGWTEWGEWKDWRGYNRPSNQPYRTLKGAKLVCRLTSVSWIGGQYREERQFRIQRRAVVLGWEDVD